MGDISYLNYYSVMSLALLILLKVALIRIGVSVDECLHKALSFTPSIT